MSLASFTCRVRATRSFRHSGNLREGSPVRTVQSTARTPGDGRRDDTGEAGQGSSGEDTERGPVDPTNGDRGTSTRILSTSAVAER